MIQSNPLLKYRIRDYSDCQTQEEEISYNMVSGLWEDKNGIPFIRTVIENEQTLQVGETIKTATREGIDQSDISLAPATQTLITRTREGVDQSEKSTFDLRTILTSTREAIDRSENVE